MLRVIALIASIAISLVACQRPEAGGPEGDRTSKTVGRDAMWAEEFGKGAEARAWLAREDTAMFKISKGEASDLIEKLYSAGAVKIVMADAGRMSDQSRAEVGATFIAELPDDVLKRRAVFKADADWSKDPEKDEGQRFLAISTD